MSDFEFAIRAKITCWYLHHEVLRRIYKPDYGGRDRAQLEGLRNALHPLISSRGRRSILWSIKLTKRTDDDLMMTPLLRDVAARALGQERGVGVTAMRELTRLIKKLDDFMEIPIVDRIAVLA